MEKRDTKNRTETDREGSENVKGRRRGHSEEENDDDDVDEETKSR